jgi:hypothetical protein
MDSMKLQKYALLYCQYDPEHGNRNYKYLLDQDRKYLTEIDQQIAANAKQDGCKDVWQIIFYGSPLSQSLEEHPEVQLTYVDSICRTANAEQRKPENILPLEYPILKIDVTLLQGNETGLLQLINVCAQALANGNCEGDFIDIYGNTIPVKIKVCYEPEDLQL